MTNVIMVPAFDSHHDICGKKHLVIEGYRSCWPIISRIIISGLRIVLGVGQSCGEAGGHKTFHLFAFSSSQSQLRTNIRGPDLLFPLIWLLPAHFGDFCGHFGGGHKWVT